MCFDYLQTNILVAGNINGVNVANGGVQTFNDPSPITYTNATSPNPSAAELKNGIFIINNSSTTSTTIDPPTGTDLTNSFTNLQIGDSFVTYVYMSASMGTGDVNMGVNTDVTRVGQPKSAATQSSFVATFNYRGGVTWVVYF